MFYRETVTKTASDSHSQEAEIDHDIYLDYFRISYF